MAKFAKTNSREILKCNVFAKISSRENKKKMKIFLRKLVPAKINSLKVVYQNANHNKSLPSFVVSIFSSKGMLFPNGEMGTVYCLPFQFLFALNSKKEGRYNAFIWYIFSKTHLNFKNILNFSQKPNINFLITNQ